MTTALEKDQAYREAFLAHLSNKLAAPTSEWPTVRCWTDSNLTRIFKQVRDVLAAEGTERKLTNRSLLEWVCCLGLAFPLPVDGESIYFLEIGAGANAEVDPHELLMASAPAGVVCYSSAVAFHSLTTQLVEHHHVVELHRQSPSPLRKRMDDDASDHFERETISTSRMPRGYGTLLFRYQGVPFYSSRRSTRLIPGVQTRGYGPRTQVRITTLEQTLLDTLYKPFLCGGPEIIFEAWQEAVTSRRVDEERLIDYLRTMNYPATTRRLGAMLEHLGWTPHDELKRVLESCQKAINRSSPFARISLLPGVDYENLNESWLVEMP
jgi:hypothetical protein